MSKSRKTVVLGVAALVLAGVWVDITGYLDVFSNPSTTGPWQEAARYACYVGRIAVALFFLLLPRQSDSPLGRSIPLMLCCMVAGTLLYSFGFYQPSFSHYYIVVVGAALIGIGHIWMVAAVYLHLMRACGVRELLYALVVAQVVERIAAELGSFLDATSLVTLSYLLPVAAAAAFALSGRAAAGQRVARPEACGVSRGPKKAYFVVLCVMTGIGLVACGAMSTVGIWGSAGEGQYAGEGGSLATAAVECAVVVLCCRITFIVSAEKPLALRYQSSLLVLVTGFVLMSAKQLLVPAPVEVVGSLLVIVENYAHVLFWVVALDAARSLESPAHRVFGVGLMSCSIAGLAWSFFLEHHATAAESIVFVSFYLLIVVCIVYPQAFNRANVKSSGDEGAINAFAFDGEERLTPGVNGHALRIALDQRCACVAKEYGLSAREEEVLVLLVRGDTRRSMCDTLSLSEGTVKTHLTHIYGKLGIHSRTELIGIVYGADERE